MQTLEYGIPTDKFATELEFGLERGFFRSEGIELSLRIVFGGPEIAAMYNSGVLKIGEIGSPPATTAIANGATFKVVGSGIRRRALQYLVVNSTIETWAEFKGKSVGVLSVGSCSYWFTRLVLSQNGIDSDRDVEVVGLGPLFPNLIDLLASNELQAAVISEFNVSVGEYRGAFRIFKALAEPEFCPTMQWMVTVANRDVIEREPELIRAVLRASRQSYRYAAEHPDEFAQFAAHHYGVAPATIRRAVEREGADLHYDCEIDMAGLDLAIDLQHRLGAFALPMHAADITDLRYIPTNAVSA